MEALGEKERAFYMQGDALGALCPSEVLCNRGPVIPATGLKLSSGNWLVARILPGQGAPPSQLFPAPPGWDVAEVQNDEEGG